MNPFKDRQFCSQLFLLIQKYDLFPAGSRLLLAVSGGLDSMVMLDFFRRFAAAKYHSQLWVAHLDHGLRPESAQQAVELEQWCMQNDLAFVSQRLDLDPAARGIEARAREQRYAWLASQATALEASHLVTGHTASDQLETMLMHWVRGGVSGLAGIRVQRPWQQGRLVRPLLACNRADIIAYASAHQIPHWEDSSNQSADFFRNRLRQRLIPELLQENPQLEQLVVGQSQILHDEQDYLTQLAQEALTTCLTENAETMLVSLPALRTYPVALQRRIIREVLTRYLGRWRLFTQQHIEAILALADGPGGKQLDLPAGLQVHKKGTQLFFRRGDA